MDEFSAHRSQTTGAVLDGRMFEIIRADTKTAVEKSNELIRSNKVSAVIGPVSSAERDAIQSTYERFKSPLLYATDYEGGVCSPYVTCYSALPAHTVAPLVDYALETGSTSFFLLGSDYIWPQKMNASFRTEAESRGASIAGEEYGAWGAKDYAPTLRKIESTGADTVVLTVVGGDAVTFVTQFAASPLKGKVRVLFFGFSENYLSGLSVEESEGIIGTANFIATLDKPEAKELVAKVRARYGDSAIISNTVDAHYTMTRILIEAFNAAMLDMPILSGNGEVQIRSADRHADLNVLIVRAKAGQMTVLKDIGRIDAPSQCS